MRLPVQVPFSFIPLAPVKNIEFILKIVLLVRLLIQLLNIKLPELLGRQPSPLRVIVRSLKRE